MSEWRDFGIEELGELQNARRIPLSSTQPGTRKGEYPYYGASGIVDYIDDFIFEGEYVLISEDGENLRTRKTPIAFFADGKFWVNNHAHILKCKTDYLTKLVIYQFSQLDLNEYITGAVQPKLNKASLCSIRISLPECADEQRAIAGVLSSLDDKIDLLHRQNRTLEAMAETLFRQWFVEEAGEDWEEGVLPDEFDFTMGQSPPGESFNETGDGIPMFQGNADFGFRFPSLRVYTTAPKRFAGPLDTLISVRAPVGAQNMARSKCCIGRGLAAFRYKRDPSFRTYTFYKLRSMMEDFRQFNGEGTVFGSISKSDIEQLKSPIPSQLHFREKY